MRLVLDTNVVASGLLWGGAPRLLLTAGRERRVALFTSPPLMQKLADILLRKKFERKTAASRLSVDEFLAGYGDLAAVVKPSEKGPIKSVERRKISLCPVPFRFPFRFKAKAHLDLAMRRDKGENNDQTNVREHRADVFRLLHLLPKDERIVLPEETAAEMASFAAEVDADGYFQPKDIGLPGDAAAQTARLRTIYGISAA